MRTSRRRLVLGGTTLAASAAFLAACGGSDSGDKQPGEAASKIFNNPKEEAPQKRGGIWPQPGAEPVNLDAFAQATTAVPTQITSYVYSRLVKFKTEAGLDPNLFTPQPDLSESYEVSPDGL